jgi:hypothetical protein
LLKVQFFWQFKIKEKEKLSLNFTHSIILVFNIKSQETAERFLRFHFNFRLAFMLNLKHSFLPEQKTTFSVSPLDAESNGIIGLI